MWNDALYNDVDMSVVRDKSGVVTNVAVISRVQLCAGLEISFPDLLMPNSIMKTLYVFN